MIKQLDLFEYKSDILLGEITDRIFMSDDYIGGGIECSVFNFDENSVIKLFPDKSGAIEALEFGKLLASKGLFPALCSELIYINYMKVINCNDRLRNDFEDEFYYGFVVEKVQLIDEDEFKNLYDCNSDDSSDYHILEFLLSDNFDYYDFHAGNLGYTLDRKLVCIDSGVFGRKKVDRGSMVVS